jgi:hypothetical protein
MAANCVRASRKLDKYSWLLTLVMMFVLLLPQGDLRWSCNFCGVDGCAFWLFVFCVEGGLAAQASLLSLRTSGKDTQRWINRQQQLTLQSDDLVYSCSQC